MAENHPHTESNTNAGEKSTNLHVPTVPAVLPLLPPNSELVKLFLNSIWIVPADTLLAYRTIAFIRQQVQDQTVWKIEEFNQGYLYGTAYAAIDGKPTSKTSVIGSITPYGHVLFEFYSSKLKTKGEGQFIQINGKWQFVMQMTAVSTPLAENTADIDIATLTHWSYMIRITKADKEYEHLPGVNMSVDKFIAMFDKL